MNREEFNKKYGTEKQCQEYFYKIRWGNGFKCPKCGCEKHYRIKEYKFKCANNECYYQSTLTTGTLLEKTHLPLTTWYRAIWYITSNDKIIKQELKEELGIKNGRVIKSLVHKIQWAMRKGKLGKLKGKVIIVTPKTKLKDGEFSFVVGMECVGNNTKRIIISKKIDVKEFAKLFIDENVNYITKYWRESWHYHNIEIPFSNYFFRFKSTDDLDRELKRFCKFYNATNNKFEFESLLNAVLTEKPFKFELTPWELFIKKKNITTGRIIAK